MSTKTLKSQVSPSCVSSLPSPWVPSCPPSWHAIMGADFIPSPSGQGPRWAVLAQPRAVSGLPPPRDQPEPGRGSQLWRRRDSWARQHLPSGPSPSGDPRPRRLCWLVSGRHPSACRASPARAPGPLGSFSLLLPLPGRPPRTSSPSSLGREFSAPVSPSSSSRVDSCPLALGVSDLSALRPSLDSLRESPSWSGRPGGCAVPSRRSVGCPGLDSPLFPALSTSGLATWAQRCPLVP